MIFKVSYIFLETRLFKASSLKAHCPRAKTETIFHLKKIKFKNQLSFTHFKTLFRLYPQQNELNTNLHLKKII